ncbi:superoxide dismutase [Sphingobacterium daejeonense]|jgi:Fe-Mn family superoxide dismutase|uniref:Superoxide dismutase n=1 Tax=Sphingobacterium daejeonense TaxID=371142 RepID=A0ABW3RHV9_9SPHI|nr:MULTISPECIES: superoxide dismutase [Sphingobacterium]MCT1531165.1 superoxide dismutase [Sphingobacterium daejeonense]VTQ05233.1 Superoxide dismutase [Mn] [Sphingobacterium daejeonense]
MAFTLEPLPYPADALEPSIDKETMIIHHDRHHQAYVDNLNKAIAGTDAENLSLEEILKNVSKYPAAVRNNAGGVWNHDLFWKVLGPNAGGEPTGELAEDINATFGSFDDLKKKLQEAGAGRFGSGWSWLIVGEDGKLAVVSTPNQDNPLMDVAEVKGTPIFGIDVWEHAYYLKYQNKRPAYLEEIFNVVNWDDVAKRYQEAKKG